MLFRSVLFEGWCCYETEVRKTTILLILQSYGFSGIIEAVGCFIGGFI